MRPNQNRNKSGKPDRENQRPSGKSYKAKSNPSKNRERRPERTSTAYPVNENENQIPDEERLEGRNSVAEALAAGRTFNKVWYLKPLPDKKMDHRLGEILHKLGETAAVLYPVDRKTLDRMSVTPSHQGIIAQVAAHEYAEVEDILAKAEVAGQKPFILILDQIKDSQNLGAILRTADAVGVHGIIIPRRRSVSLDAAAAKSSAGAIEYVPVARVTNLNRTIEDLKKQNIWIAGLAMEGETIFESNNLDTALALVVGSEGEGISSSIQANCDFLLSIPMSGKINSLNASNAAAIALYEVYRRRALTKE